MIKNKFIYLILLSCCWIGTSLSAQEQTECNPTEGLPITQGDINFNYGSVTNGFSFDSQSSFTIGQPMVHRAVSQDYKTQTGFWSFFLIPPQAPVVMSTQGSFPDRIEVSWQPEPLGSQPTEGFKILRDGAFLTQVDGETFQFVDFNVQAGELYEYSVIGKNQFGQGVPGTSVGFVNPNGIVTGKVETFTGNPIPGAVVTLSPTIGNSLKLNGEGDYVCISHDSQLPMDMFTISTWVKIGATHDSDGIIDLGSDLNKNFWVHTTPSNMEKGIVVGVGDGTAHEITYEFIDDTPENGTDDRDDWHHIAAVYGGGSLILYVNGNFITSMQAGMTNEAALFSIGSRRDQAGFFDGNLDDMRIYNRLLTQTEIISSKNITVSKRTEGLVAYWKFDEGLGTKVFDLSNNGMDGTLTGTTFDTDTPDIKNAGITDESGFYAIEGINYSQEQTFLAKPEKIFYDNYALEFNAAYEACATLTNFDLRDTSHIELTVHPFDLNSKQSILSKMQSGSEAFNFYVENAKFYLSINDESQELGVATAAYQHIALGINAITNEVTYYNNGNEITTLSYSTTGGTWDDEVWQLGAKGVLSPVDYYTGLIDEVAFYQGAIITLADIQLNAASFGAGGTDIGNGSLTSYFDLNEGQGTELSDIGAAMTGTGEVKNAAFSIITYRQGQTPHDFQPDNKLININPSATAVPNIDFIDVSTVPIAGVVRFENTFCFQEGVEILVNGQSYAPQIFTDENGRFVADFEPGATVKLTPKFGEDDEAHLFFPGFFETRKINRPIAGVLFQNLTKREVVGQMAGGYCRKSVISEEAIVKVKVRALNGCYEQEKQIENADGNFSFTNLPPMPMAVSVIEHSNNVIYDYFQIGGGLETDLRSIEKDTVDFIYFSPPNVELSELPVNSCGDPMLNMLQNTTTTIQVFEQYDGGRCYVDTALLTINNDIAHLEQFDTLMTEGSLEHQYRVEEPNIVPPYLKGIQVTATLVNGAATESINAVVLGRRPRETTFASTAPEMPTLILRDPPGDASYAYMESGETTCQNWSFSSADVMNENANITLHLGPDIETEVGTPFFATSFQMDVTADAGYIMEASTTAYSSTEMETCLTTTRTISTGDNDLIVGSEMGGDVYLGGAMNFIFGITDELIYDEDNCEFILDKGLYVFPGGFATTFVYTENHIENIVIPNLITTGELEAATRWEEIIERNTQLKQSATFSKNISFDAGVVYEESETTEASKTVTNSWTQTFDQGFSAAFGNTVNGLGITEGVEMTWGTEDSGSTGTTNSTTRTVGYTLADDDFFDNFTVNIKKDEAYGTPVFDLVSGQSSCPHEPNTQPREEVFFSADEYVAVNIPAEDAATYTLTLGNIAPSNDVGFYTLELVTESNPFNAIVTVNGEVLNAPASFEVLPGENVVVDFAIQRGPDNINYTYEDIKLAYYSSCEFEHAMNLGIPRAGVDPKFYQELSFDAYFLEPCSPIGIGSPMEGWVVTPDDNEQMVITLNDYINDDPDLELLRVQYRPTDGDGSWINIVEIPKAELTNDVFHTLTWDLSLLKDGLYEIRAISQCTDQSLAPGITRVIRGRKETQPPVVFGIPQPSDGILHQGDEISITFSKRIQCDQIFAADGIGTNININNIGLYDATNGTLVDMTFACNEDKIVITPNVANQFIENRFLKVIVNDIQDLYGNETEQIEWEFYVNRSNLIWEGGTINEGLEEGQSLTVTRKIRNQGATIADFDIIDIPDWMSASPTSGTLLPGETQLITFEFAADLVADDYSQTVNIDASDGYEPLKVDLRVTCAGPVWDFEPSDYIYTMNMTIQLNIEGELSTDEMDRVGAFITNADGDEELRGWSHVQLEPSITPPGSPNGTYFAFLTLYSNEFSGEDITLKIWDVSDCILYGQVLEDFTYEADGLIGSPLEPQVVHTVNLISRTIPIHQGWNWISYNVDLPDASINTALESLTQPQNSLIKNQTDFSVYSAVNGGFTGSLTDMTHRTMYQYRSEAIDSLVLTGRPIDPDTVPIDILTGWNWIGFLPQQGMPVADALASLSPLNGDIVKSQIAFAQYVAGTGWIGNLNFMSSPNGYLLKISNDGTLVYPREFTEPAVVESRNAYDNYWELQPELYQYTMNMIGVVLNETNLLEDGDEVGAFYNNELRGVGQTVYIESLNAYVVFLTAYANEEGEELTFKFYDRSAEEEIDLQEQFNFMANVIYGSVETPEVWTLAGASSTLNWATDESFEVYPNPAKERVYLKFHNPIAERIVVRVTDALGREVERMETQAGIGDLTLEWIPSDLSEGLYFINLDRANSSVTRKVRIAK